MLVVGTGNLSAAVFYGRKTMLPVVTAASEDLDFAEPMITTRDEIVNGSNQS